MVVGCAGCMGAAWVLNCVGRVAGRMVCAPEVIVRREEAALLVGGSVGGEGGGG